MKKKFKLMFTFMVMLCLAICLGVNASAAEVVDSGDCGADGDNVTWVLYDDGNLVISGMGKMADGFYNTVELDAVKSIDIEYGVTSIGIYSFTSFVNLESVSFSETVKNIGAISFGLCGKLKEVTIPYGVREIAEGTFSSCTSLTSIEVPNSVKSICESAFENCENLTSVTIGSSVESIDRHAFWYCDKITDVYYNGTVDEWNEISIDEDGNDSLTNATIHYLICEHEDADSEAGCDKCGSVVAYSGSCGADGDNVTFELYDDGYLVVSGEGDMYDYANWNESVFKEYDSDIKAVVIEDGVTSIGDYSFDSFDITDLTIANSVTRIGENAFHGCDVADLTIPGSVEIIGTDAFSGSDKLVSVTFENGIMSIADWAFSVCYNISDLFIPASVTNIGEGAFAYDIFLKNITVDENNEYYSSVDGVLFNKDKTKIITYPAMSAATSYTIPDGVIDIDLGVFIFALNLVDVVIPDSVENIGEAMFVECHNLETVKIGSGVKYIGEWMIDDFYSLTDVTYNGTEEQWNNIEIGENEVLEALVRFEPTACDHKDSDKDGLCDNCNEIFVVNKGDCGAEGDNATWTLYSNGNVVISGNGVVVSPQVSFDEVVSVAKHLIIEDGITGIDETAFIQWFYLENITIPASVTNIGIAAFAWTPYLERITVDENNEYYSSDNGILFNKDKTELIAYTCGSEETSYTIPDGVKIIADGAFIGSPNLVEVVIPDSVTSIGMSAFGSCEKLTTVTIGSGVTYMGMDTFAESDNITDVYYNGTKADWNNISAEDPCLDNATIHFLKHVDSDNDSLCDDCNEIFVVDTGVCGDNVTWILYSDGKLVISGEGAIAENSFRRSAEIKNVIIEDGVTSIGDYAFWCCDNLTDVVIPDSVTSIGEGALMECISLTDVSIPASVTNIARGAFACSPLTEIAVDENNEYYTVYNGVLFNKDKTQLIAYPAAKTETSYVVPDSVTSIIDIAFGGVENLTSIVVTDNVINIGTMAFYYCSNIESFTISDSVVNVGITIFEGCESLTDIYYEGTEEQWYALGMEEYVDMPEYGIALHFNYSAHVHTPGEWVVVTEATYEAEGKKEQRCTGCGELLAEEVMPKLVKVTVADDKTGVAIEFDSDDYDGEVEVEVEETFDGKAFELIDTTVGASKATVFDISMSVDGVTVQPNGKITVKIPLPEGYNPAQCFIYYLNTDNNTIEKLPTSYADGYLSFETDHFSYYAVVEVAETADDSADDCSCMCHKSGFMGFIWMIINFFQKLFKTNQICSCGISHY